MKILFVCGNRDWHGFTAIQVYFMVITLFTTTEFGNLSFFGTNPCSQVVVTVSAWPALANCEFSPGPVGFLSRPGADATLYRRGMLTNDGRYFYSSQCFMTMGETSWGKPPKFDMFWSFFSIPRLRTPFNYCILYHYIIVSFFMPAACMCYGPAMDTQTSAYTHNIYIPYTFAHTHTTYVHTHIYIYIRDHHHLWGEGGL